MTVQRIKEAALIQFAIHGYDGASLADIASEVGIKKPSIYAHFSGKDELFLEVFHDALGRELDFVRHYFHRTQQEPFKEVLYGFLLQYLDRYVKDRNTNFFLRTVFFPPVHLKQQTVDSGNDFVDQLEKLLVPIFHKAIADKSISPAVNEEIAATAYTAALDGLFVELFFGGAERALKRAQASWLVYWRGIQSQPEVT
ncbi:TetR/AcrR family transcriptional regulator [Paenibacillus sp. GD4]|uniref:TetR/AcrR family transcriptional regulator n=1 Tax=Paenibacillus sp. GD4 TaxID=3068890 RepID=UPI0027965FE5|nr:TetR/AcrR family transcriptional regulator [Paenibacillus sp. GD4]MDQ1910808.1 TetR/AcrR family transcriptional regulator [Paenibacillus sp. GD4]